MIGACRTPREKRVIWVLLDTGLHIRELAKLARGRIDFENQCLYSGERESHDRTYDVRALPLTPRIEPILKSWFGKNESFGLSSRSVQRLIKDVAARAGLGRPICAAALRHTFAVAALRRGVPLVKLLRLST